MKKVTSALENYLKAIYIIQKKEGYVRVRDLSEMLGVRGASVVNALQRLEAQGLSNHERYGKVELTAKGTGIAKDILKRHKNIKYLLNEILCVDENIADKDACEIEHALNPETFRNINKFREFMDKNELKEILLFKKHLRRERAAGDIKTV